MDKEMTAQKRQQNKLVTVKFYNKMEFQHHSDTLRLVDRDVGAATINVSLHII